MTASRLAAPSLLMKKSNIEDQVALEGRRSLCGTDDPPSAARTLAYLDEAIVALTSAATMLREAENNAAAK